MSTGRHLRHRNVDFGKPLAVILETPPPQRKQLAPPPSSSSPSCKAKSGGKRSRSPSPNQRQIVRSTTTLEAVKKVEFIPTPEVHTLQAPGVSILKQTRFSRPRHYIHVNLTTGSGLLDDSVRYDLLVDDMQWCDERNRYPGLAESDKLTYDQLEALIGLFERTAGARTQQYDCQSVFGLAEAGRKASSTLRLPGRAVEDVYQYWISKRRRKGESLMRIFQKPASHDDPSPHVAFRTRESFRRVSTRNPRKNDSMAFSQMRRLRRDLGQLFSIVKAVRKRESVKRHRILLCAEIFDAELLQTRWGQSWFALANSPTRSLEIHEVLKLKTSSLPRSQYEKDILLSRMKKNALEQQQQQKRRFLPKRPRGRIPPVSMGNLPHVHTNLFDMKFPDALMLSSAESDSSEGENDADAAFFRHVDRYIDESLRKKPRKIRTVDPYPEHVGQLLFRYARDNRLVLDRIIFEKVAMTAPGSGSGNRGSSPGNLFAGTASPVALLPETATPEKPEVAL